MSDTDGFIQEVTEELRRDRMYKLWRRWGPVVIGGVVLVVIAAAVMEWRKQEATAEARRAGGVLLEAMDSVAPSTKRIRFEEAAASLPEGPALAAAMGGAVAAAEAGDVDGAISILRGLEQDGGIDPLYRDLAGFRAALLEAPRLTPAERAEAMTPYAAETHPFRLLALERRAVALYEAGELEAARADVDNALADAMASAQLRGRLAQLSELLGAPQGAE